MKVHLFATDVSGLRLLEDVGNGIAISCLIVPANRRGAAKIAELETAAKAPIVVHERGKTLPEGLPPADAAISWLYSQIIREQDIRRYPLGVLNMHGGQIPAYRGANVLQWAIINGERELGITWHELVKEVDAGPIWAESAIEIPVEATALEMRARMIEAGGSLFQTAWQRFIAREFTPRIAKLDDGRIWPSRKPEDGRIGPRWPEHKVRDMVRALCSPWPAATVLIENNWLPVRSVSQQHVDNAILYQTAEGRDIFLLPASATP